MTDPEQVNLELLAEFAATIDPLLRGVLAGADAGEDVQEIRGFILEAAGSCMQRPYIDLWGVGELYRAWMEIDDILDGWPIDYGDDTDALARRELTLAAREWLDMPRTETGFRTYVHRWDTRVAQDDWPAPGGIPWQQR